MLVLTIRTDKPEVEIGLFVDSSELINKKWEAHRHLAETLHTEIKAILESQKKDWTDIQAVVCYEGPGSFTGLRIGLAVANSLAYSLNIPTVGTTGDNWQKIGIKDLKQGKNIRVVKPNYGADAHITKPKK